MAKRTNFREVARTFLRSLHSDIRVELGNAPSWVAERVEDFATKTGLIPFVKTKPKSKLGKVEEPTAGPNAGGYAIGTGPATEDGMEGVGQRFQEFYADLEDELTRRKWGSVRGFGRGIVQHLNGSAATPSDSANTSSDERAADVFDEKEKDVEETAEDQKEKRVHEVMEAVERTLCSLFYDRYVHTSLPVR